MQEHDQILRSLIRIGQIESQALKKIHVLIEVQKLREIR